ncbi:prepilin-type cleavage/methylation domain-containing protein [Cyanobium sp. FGCU-52]|nr:prepilin-type cleavage/methylation domain-containing protein [Cyanobium sp. FGCU52]
MDRSPTPSPGFSLLEALLALCLGLGLCAVILQTLLVDGRNLERLVRRQREGGLQRRTLDLVRADLLRAHRLDPAGGGGAACSLSGRTPVLQVRTAEGPITYSHGAAPSAIWRGRVLMRCGPAFGLHGEPSGGAAQNRVLIDALPVDGVAAEPVAPGRLRLRLTQEFVLPEGTAQRIETVRELAAPPG